MYDTDSLLKEALRETRNLEHNETFLVRDLFKGYIWKRIPLKNRLTLGSMFLGRVTEQDYGVKPTEKGVSGQQVYIKK